MFQPKWKAPSKAGRKVWRLQSLPIDYALGQSPTVSSTKLVYDKSDVKVESAIDTNQGKIFCVGHNYREHILEMGREIPLNTVLFAKFANTIIGPDDDIPFYPISEQLDYEAEFTFVIGKRTRNVCRGGCSRLCSRLYDHE